ncbi:MAG: hypothetical protein EOM06_11230 [Sphingobacteriia bacterium]|nr:hypothetical protein [Sphingobacteriia bacterium]
MKTILEKRELIRSASVEAKDDFLFEMMHNNDRLLDRFEEFVKDFSQGGNHSRRELNVLNFETEIAETYDAFREGLKELEDHLNRIENSGRQLMSKDAQDAANEFYEAWRVDILTEISADYHFQALAILCGMMAANTEFFGTGAGDEDSDSLNIFLNNKINTEINQVFATCFTTIAADDEDVIAVSDSIFQFALNHQLKLLNNLTNFFSHLVKTPNQAKSIINSLEENSIPLQIIPELADLLTRKTGDINTWLQLAKAVFPEHTELAKKLLDYYFENIPEDFDHYAMIAFKHLGLLLADYLEGKIKPEGALYCQLQMELAASKNSMTHYVQARKCLSREEAIAFAKDQPDFSFKLEILKHEKAWDEIKLMANSKQAFDKLHELLPPIMEVFPGECLNIIGKAAAHIYRNHRHREGYARLADCLQLATIVPLPQDQINELINHYRDLAQKLPALKDELRVKNLL